MRLSISSEWLSPTTFRWRLPGKRLHNVNECSCVLPARLTVSDVTVTHSAPSQMLASLSHVNNEVVERGDGQRDIVLAARERGGVDSKGGGRGG